MLARNEIDVQNPSSLFKFFRFDKNALSGLIKDTLWFADPRSFNDPFDMLLTFDESFTNYELATYLNNCAVTRGEPQIYTADNVQDQRDEILKSLDDTRNIIQSCGVVSFSATPYESLMWSHYADQHRGFCIEFERNSTTYSAASSSRFLKASRPGTCMAARCNCLRRCASSMAPMRAANGSDEANPKRISSTSSRSSMARSRPSSLDALLDALLKGLFREIPHYRRFVHGRLRDDGHYRF